MDRWLAVLLMVQVLTCTTLITSPVVSAASLEPGSLYIHRSKIDRDYFSQSAVFMSSRWERSNLNAYFKIFHPTHLVWVYSDNPTFINEIKGMGLEYGAAIDGGCLNGRLSEIKAGYALNLEGDPIIPPWQEGWVPLRYLGDCTDPVFRTLFIEEGHNYLEMGVNNIQVDDWRMLYAALWWGGAFTDSIVAGFRDYLQRNLSPEELLAYGIDAIEGFDYRSYLRERYGIETSEEYRVRASSVPLNGPYRSFLLQTVRDTFQWFRSELEAEYGPIRLSVNANFQSLNQLDWFVFDQVDYFIGEANCDFVDYIDMIIACRLADALGTAQVFSPRYPNEYPGATQASIALAYAFGQYLLVPWDVWIRGQTDRYFGSAEEYAHYYEFIREYAHLFDGYESFSPVRVVVAVDGTEGYTRALVRAMLEAQVPFTFAVSGGAPIRIPLQKEDLGNAKAIVTALPASQYPQEDQMLIEQIVSQGVELFEARQLIARLRQDPEWVQELAPVMVEDDDLIVVPRVNPNDPEAPIVLHVLNRKHDPERGVVLPRENIRIVIKPGEYWGREIQRVTYYQPNKPMRLGAAQSRAIEPLPLTYTVSSDGFEITIDSLQVWGIITLD